jgi:excisionase family DNA binding protein
MTNPFETIEERLSRIEILLINIKFQAGDTGTQSDELLTIGQAAELLSITTPTVYGLVHKHAIPYSKKGKRLYFSKSELLDWIKSGRRKTIAESMENPENHLKTPKRRAAV